MTTTADTPIQHTPLSPFQRWIVSGKWGNHLTEHSKKAVFGAKGREDHGAVFDTIDTSSYPVVNNDAVKKQFPQEQFPGLYRTQTRKAYVTIDLPFNTKKIQQPSG